MSKFLQNLKVEQENYGLLGTIYFAFFASGLMSVMLSAILPYVRDENALNYAQSGLMLSAHQFGNLCAVLVAGVLPYAIGRKKSTLLMSSATVLGLALMMLVHSSWTLAAAFALTGIGRGTMSNICNVVISDTSGNKTGALNLLHAIFATGALISPVVVYAFTRSSSEGWKFSALTAAALSVAAWSLIARSKLSDTPSEKESGGSFSFLKSASFWVNTMILFFYLCAEVSIVGWLVIYFEDTGILPSSAAKFVPAMLWLMIMAGRLLCAAFFSLLDKNKLLLVLSLCFSLCFAGMLASRSTAACIAFLLGTGFSMAGIYPTILSVMQGSSSTVATGFLIAIAGLGGILMPGIVGAVADSHGLAGGVAMILTALAAMIILIIAKLVAIRRERL